jgi:predicted phosphodiesterase
VRVGLLSDVHANLPALRAAIARLRAEGVDTWMCAGDLVGYGPNPNECVETVAELGPVCVTGNHELLVLGEIPDGRAGRLARTTTAWTRGVLRADVRSYLADLPRVAHVAEVLVTHGSLDGPEEYVRREEQAAGQLSRLDTEHPGVRLLVLGHTHRQWLFGETAGTVVPATVDRTVGGAGRLAGTERFLVNPGAVGQSREREPVPRARFALLDLGRAEARFFAEPYDVAACRRALRQRGLPRESIHVVPGPAAKIARQARRLLARRPVATPG